MSFEGTLVALLVHVALLAVWAWLAWAHLKVVAKLTGEAKGHAAFAADAGKATKESLQDAIELLGPGGRLR